MQLPVVLLVPNPFQPRKHIDPDALEELAVSIEQKGIMQPILVRKQEDTYQIIAGERRWRAAQRAGLKEVPVILKDLSDQDMLELAIIENIQREELNAVEEARAYRQLIQEFHLSQEQVAERVGKSRVAVTNLMRLLKLPEQILQWIEEKAITAGHAKPLLSLDNEGLQLALAREIMGKGLSVREAERRVRQVLKSPKTDVKAEQPNIEIGTADLEEKLRLHLGLQVRILPKTNDQGRIEVIYSSLDEFQRFFDHLGISLEQEV